MAHTAQSIENKTVILLSTQQCRISYFDRGSAQLVITFNSMGQTLDDDFGRDFLEQLNISQINVACTSKDFFQSLSLESFLEAVSPMVNNHSDIVTYGTSLGGYAAIYFGSVLQARTLAIAPRLPIHRYMEGLRSYNPNIEIKHDDLRDVKNLRNNMVTVFDPDEEADAKFVSYFLADRENTSFIELNGAGHFILEQLKTINMLAPCIESYIRSNDFKEKTIDTSAFTQPRRDKAQQALDDGNLATARAEIEYLIDIRTGHDPFMTPWGLIKQYVELCKTIDIELPQILPTEYATLSRRMGQPATPQKMMEAIIKHNYLTCQYQACLTLAELTITRYPDSQIAQAYIEKASSVMTKFKPKPNTD